MHAEAYLDFKFLPADSTAEWDFGGWGRSFVNKRSYRENHVPLTNRARTEDGNNVHLYCCQWHPSLLFISISRLGQTAQLYWSFTNLLIG